MAYSAAQKEHDLSIYASENLSKFYSAEHISELKSEFGDRLRKNHSTAVRKLALKGRKCPSDTDAVSISFDWEDTLAAQMRGTLLDRVQATQDLQAQNTDLQQQVKKLKVDAVRKTDKQKTGNYAASGPKRKTQLRQVSVCLAFVDRRSKSATCTARSCCKTTALPSNPWS